MKYLTYANRSDAQNRSAEIATAMGCGRGFGDITKYWFLAIEHPTTKAGALAVPSDEETKLTTPEKATLTDESTMKTAGWMPPPK